MNMTKHLKLFYSKTRQISSQKALNSSRNHYDSLGVTSKATQADIKSAYYKLSMVYHPDRSQNNIEASQKFRDITEAYEVLGNVKSRKIYDRGLFFGRTASTYDEPVTNKFYKSRDVKSKPPAPQGRTTVYDFDEWSKAHYGATFQRDIRFREKERFKIRRQQQVAEDIKSEQAMLLITTIILLGLYLTYHKDYDEVRTGAVAFGSSDVIIESKSD